MLRVSLDGLRGLALVVEMETGVRYEAQVAGAFEIHFQVEGLLVPLMDDEGLVQRLLETFFSRRVKCEEHEVDELDALLRGHLVTSFIRVDRTRLDDCWNEWIPVIVNAVPHVQLPFAHLWGEPLGCPIRGFPECRGALTWSPFD